MAYYVNNDGSVTGPYDGSQLKALAGKGEVTIDSMIAESDQGPWVLARNVRGLFASQSSALTSAQQAAVKTCPYCGETILAVAIKCKHCQEMLDQRLPTHSASDSFSPAHHAGGTAAVADSEVVYPEIKRTCNRCGRFWFSDSNEEQTLSVGHGYDTLAALSLGVGGLVSGFGGAGSFTSNDSRQRIQNQAEAKREKLAALLRCPQCNSTSYTEIKPQKVTHADETFQAFQEIGRSSQATTLTPQWVVGVGLLLIIGGIPYLSSSVWGFVALILGFIAVVVVLAVNTQE